MKKKFKSRWNNPELKLKLVRNLIERELLNTKLYLLSCEMNRNKAEQRNILKKLNLLGRKTNGN